MADKRAPTPVPTEMFDEPSTGVHDDPLSKIEKRTRRLQRDHLEMAAKVDAVDARVEKVESQVEKVDGKVETVDGKVDSVIGHVSDLREKTAVRDGKIETIDGKLDTLLVHHNAKVRVATEVELQDVKTGGFVKRTKWKLVYRVLLALLGLLVLVASHYVAIKLGSK